MIDYLIHIEDHPIFVLFLMTGIVLGLYGVAELWFRWSFKRDAKRLAQLHAVRSMRTSMIPPPSRSAPPMPKVQQPPRPMPKPKSGHVPPRALPPRPSEDYSTPSPVFEYKPSNDSFSNQVNFSGGGGSFGGGGASGSWDSGSSSGSSSYSGSSSSGGSNE